MGNSVKHRHSLSIMDISTEKLGQYQCKAVNSLGQAMNTVTVTGLASPAVILSPSNGEDSNLYTLKWRSSSISPIQMFRGEVQREGEEREDAAWVVTEVVTEEKEEEIEEGEVGQKKKEATTYHGS